MKQTPKLQAAIVGLFIAGGTLIIGGGILTVGDINDTFTRKVNVSVVFEEVNGLQRGDNVWYSGVKVGVIKKLAFSEGSRVAVEMRIDASATAFIPADANAKIGSDGLIGSTIVVVYGGTPGSETLKSGDTLISGKAASTEEIMVTLQENNQNLLAITSDLKTITGKVRAGEGTVGLLLNDDQLYTKVNETVTKLDSAADSAKTMTASLSSFSADLNRKGNLAHDLVNDRTSYPALTEAVGNLNTASASANTLVGSLSKAATDPSTVVGTLINDSEAGADAKTTLDNLSRSSALLEEDLEAIQHNFLFKGYFKKKRKAEKAAQ